MRRQLIVLALTGIIGSLVLAGDASACHKKKCAPAPCAAPAPCVTVAPCPAPAPVPCAAPAPVACAPRKHCFSGFKLPSFKGFGCHKKQAVVCPAPVVATAPCATPQVVPSYQALPSGQGF